MYISCLHDEYVSTYCMIIKVFLRRPSLAVLEEFSKDLSDIHLFCTTTSKQKIYFICS